MRLRRLLVVGACLSLLAGACSSRGEDDARASFPEHTLDEVFGGHEVAGLDRRLHVRSLGNRDGPVYWASHPGSRLGAAGDGELVLQGAAATFSADRL